MRGWGGSPTHSIHCRIWPARRYLLLHGILRPGVPLAPYFGKRIGQQCWGSRRDTTALDGLPFPSRPYYHGNRVSRAIGVCLTACSMRSGYDMNRRQLCRSAGKRFFARVNPIPVRKSRLSDRCQVRRRLAQILGLLRMQVSRRGNGCSGSCFIGNCNTAGMRKPIAMAYAGHSYTVMAPSSLLASGRLAQ